MTRPADPDAEDADVGGERRGGRVATFIALFAVGVAAVIMFWPGHMLRLVPAVQAAFGHGTPGVVHLTEVRHGKGSGAVGDFRSDDGRVVLRQRVIEIHGNRDTVGDSLRALYVPTPQTAPWAPPSDVYRASRSYEWVHPAFVTAAWIVALAWTARWLRSRAST
jgi:hypothetical protein